MAVFEQVHRSRLEATRRLDAEYYQPLYLKYETLLSQVHTEPLSRLCFVSDGNHLSIASDFLDKPGIRYLRGQDVSTSMMLDDRNKVYLSQQWYDYSQRSHIFNGDVLITIVGANTGLVGVVHNVSEKLTAYCKLGIIRSKTLSPYYFHSVLASKFGQFQILRSKRGGGQTGLVLPDVRKLRIPRLGNTVETQIAQVSLCAHQQIEEAKELYQQAEILLLTELNLHNWNPAPTKTFVQRSRNVARALRIDAEHFQPKYAEMLARLPATIRTERIGRIAQLIKGIEVGRSAYTETGVPFWRVSNLTRFGMDEGSAMYTRERDYHFLRGAYEPRPGELLLSKDATPGLALYLPDGLRGLVSGGILRLVLQNDIPPLYLELALNSRFVQMQMEQYAGGSIIKHWKPSEVRNTLIPRLPATLEQEIAGLVEQSHAARRNAQSQLHQAKRAVEIAIEHGEPAARHYLETSCEPAQE